MAELKIPYNIHDLINPTDNYQASSLRGKSAEQHSSRAVDMSTLIK